MRHRCQNSFNQNNKGPWIFQRRLARSTLAVAADLLSGLWGEISPLKQTWAGWRETERHTLVFKKPGESRKLCISPWTRKHPARRSTRYLLLLILCVACKRLGASHVPQRRLQIFHTKCLSGPQRSSMPCLPQIIFLMFFKPKGWTVIKRLGLVMFFPSRED